MEGLKLIIYLVKIIILVQDLFLGQGQIPSILFYFIFDLIGGLTAKVEELNFFYLINLFQEIYKNLDGTSKEVSLNKENSLVIIQNQTILNEKLDILRDKIQKNLENQEHVVQAFGKLVFLCEKMSSHQSSQIKVLEEIRERLKILEKVNPLPFPVFSGKISPKKKE